MKMLWSQCLMAILYPLYKVVNYYNAQSESYMEKNPSSAGHQGSSYTSHDPYYSLACEKAFFFNLIKDVL